MTNSYIIWFIDGKFTYAFGSDPEDAKSRYLTNWAAGIKEVAEVPRNAPDIRLLIPSPSNAVWGEDIDSKPAPSEKEELKAQLAALMEKVNKL